MPVRITPGDYRALAEFRHRIRLFLGFSEQAARAAGLEPRQHQLLLSLKGLPDGMPPTIGALADRLQVEHHSAVEMVDRLEDRGLVKRARDGEDRRRVLVSVTSDGERLLRQLSTLHHDELRKAIPALVKAATAAAAGRLAPEQKRAAVGKRAASTRHRVR